MKVVHVIKAKQLAGAEKYIIDIIPDLVSQNISSEILCIVERKHKKDIIPLINYASQNNVKISIVYYAFNLNPILLLKIRSFIIKGKFDMVHSHLIHADFWIALLCRLGFITSKHVSTKHGYSEPYTVKNGFNAKMIQKDLYYMLSKFSEKSLFKSYTVSQGLKQFFVDAKISQNSNVEVIHHGIKVKDNKSECNEYRFSNNQIIIVGRLVGFKGHHHALNVLAKIKQKIPDIILVVVGSGPEDASLKKMCAELNLNQNVKWLGFKNNVKDYINSSDIGLSTSISEGFGLVNLEYFNNEKPIIAFDVPALNEIVESEVNGFLIEPFDINEMANRTTELLNDKDKIKTMGQNGLKSVNQRFNFDKMIENIIQFYYD